MIISDCELRVNQGEIERSVLASLSMRDKRENNAEKTVRVVSDALRCGDRDRRHRYSYTRHRCVPTGSNYHPP